MERKSAYLIYGFIVIFVVSAFVSYRTFFIERNFLVESTTECNPEIESCFMMCEGGVCEEDYYKKIIKKDANTPICNAAFEECTPLICEPNEENCEIVYCSPDTVQDNEVCTVPADFQNRESSPENTTTEPIL